ncbi:MAG: dipeptide/oligopeptide/nickel ABC transporter permease/ATP-binding protein [SAR324 cluster bacterium]|nr:dipeptide/oligopeptide/nickel ABC transporter permease/ATP-binding protein [SAR324 cluster bacterium]
MSSRISFVKLLTGNRLTVLGLLIISAILAVVLLAPFLPLPNPDATNLSQRLTEPFHPDHFLGTDELGRDILSRLIWGTRVSLAVGIAATFFACLFGTLIGLIAGYFGKWTDNVLMRFIDILMAFPYILLALAIVAALGAGLLNALLAIAVVNVPFFARNVRGGVISIVNREYVEAARVVGSSHLQIIFEELLPNVLSIIVISISTTLGWMILETAGLSFLGLGAQPPQADLGSMLGEGRKVIFTAPHVSAIPGMLIFVLVVALNLIGDGVRDVLDPRLKSGALRRPMPATEVNFAQNKTEKKEVPYEFFMVRSLYTEFHFGKTRLRAVNEVNFELQKGQCLGIIGESGSGKSVTALSLTRLVSTPPGIITGGQVHYEDNDLIHIPFEDLRSIRGNRISYIFQDPLNTLNPLLTVGDQIAETIAEHRGLPDNEIRAEVVALLRQVKIQEPEKRMKFFPHELSGGMRQRIGIAMAIANKPEIVIADEPTTALDVTIQAEILALLKDLQKQVGMSLIFISHDFGVLSQMCDSVIVMYAGQVIEQGLMKEVLAQPAHPYTQKLLSCVPKPGSGQRRLEAIPGLPPAPEQVLPGCYFAERCELCSTECEQAPILLRPIREKQNVRCIKAENPALSGSAV